MKLRALSIAVIGFVPYLLPGLPVVDDTHRSIVRVDYRGTGDGHCHTRGDCVQEAPQPVLRVRGGHAVPDDGLFSPDREAAPSTGGGDWTCEVRGRRRCYVVTFGRRG